MQQGPGMDIGTPTKEGRYKVHVVVQNYITNILWGLGEQGDEYI